MAQRRVRLSRTGFEALLGGNRRQSEYFSIVFKNNTELAHSGVAVVVSKKVCASAVHRHLLKRQIRSILASFYQENTAIVVTVRKGIEKLSYQDIENELSTLLQSILN